VFHIAQLKEMSGSELHIIVWGLGIFIGYGGGRTI
jgi:hypothetical protein